jgi:hypothetical protein
VFLQFLAVVAAAVTLVGLIALLSWLFRNRCPSCRKFGAGRVVNSQKEVSVETSDWGYDDQRREYRHIPSRHTGYLITRSCRYCQHSWDRLESTTRQLDRMTEEEAQRYRDRKFPF